MCVIRQGNSFTKSWVGLHMMPIYELFHEAQDAKNLARIWVHVMMLDRLEFLGQAYPIFPQLMYRATIASILRLLKYSKEKSFQYLLIMHSARQLNLE